jgi:hypothetical protein
MGDIHEMRLRRKILSVRLNSYYESLLEAARREARLRWEHVIEHAAHENIAASQKEPTSAPSPLKGPR